MMNYRAIKERYVFWGLLFSFTAVFAITPFFDQKSDPISLNLFLISATFFAVLSVSKDTLRCIIASALGIAALLSVFISSFSESALALLFFYFATACFFLYISAVLLWQIFETRSVTTNTLLAAICIYFALAMIWAMAYGFIEYLIPGSFSFHEGLGQAQHMDEFMYFSVVTLTTLGYGDIVPTSPPAQSIAALESLVGQLYLTVLVARLVGLHITEEKKQARYK